MIELWKIFEVISSILDRKTMTMKECQNFDQNSKFLASQPVHFREDTSSLTSKYLKFQQFIYFPNHNSKRKTSAKITCEQLKISHHVIIFSVSSPIVDRILNPNPSTHISFSIRPLHNVKKLSTFVKRKFKISFQPAPNLRIRLWGFLF